MVNNSLIQAAWIAKLKANTAVTALVPAVEIRENMWKGQTFNYPAIRVRLNSLTPNVQSSDCKIFKSDVSILCFSEIKSSKQADDVAGVAAEQFWGRPFTYGGVKFTSINLTNIVPAYPPEWDENSWLSEVNFSCLVQAA